MPQISSRDGHLHSPDKYSLLRNQELVNLWLTLCTYAFRGFMQSHLSIPGSGPWN